MYEYSHVVLPLYFLNLFILNNKVLAHNTRQSEILHVISYNTNIRNVAYSGKDIWMLLA